MEKEDDKDKYVTNVKRQTLIKSFKQKYFGE